MSDQELVPVDVALSSWVNAAAADVSLHRDRQVTQILLTAIGLSDDLCSTLYLKGGALMALAFRSERVTADVDFTCTADQTVFADNLVRELDSAMARAAANLGYLDLKCKVQTVKKQPRSNNFSHAEFPALKVKVGYGIVGKKSEQRLDKGIASNTIELDISFNEQVYAFQILNLDGAEIAIQAYALTELVAEKLRALLQQTVRNRNRRQDVYDLNHIIGQHDLTKAELEKILETLLEKSRTRNLPVGKDTMSDPEIRERAGREWDTIQVEVDRPLPDFEKSFDVVLAFYESLPWQTNLAA